MMTTVQTGPGVPALQWVMTLRVQIAEPQELGDCVDGLRSNYRIIGGQFDGPDLQGQVMAHGADFYRQRRDGVGELDARYSLLTEQGELINVRNTGLLTLTETGRELDAQGLWPVPEAEYCCTCTPRFQVPCGRLEWLAQSTFIGRVTYPYSGAVVIHCYRLA